MRLGAVEDQGAGAVQAHAVTVGLDDVQALALCEEPLDNAGSVLDVTADVLAEAVPGGRDDSVAAAFCAARCLRRPAASLLRSA